MCIVPKFIIDWSMIMVLLVLKLFVSSHHLKLWRCPEIYVLLFQEGQAEYHTTRKKASGGAPDCHTDGSLSRECCETPRGRYDEHSGKFSLSMKPRLNRPVGGRESSEGWCHWRWQGALPVSATTWNLHTTQPKYFAPNGTVRLSISPVLLKTKD